MNSLVVSIHDVSPLTLEATQAIIGDLKSLGLTKYSLLVIPDHHRRGHFLQDPAFCQWLKSETADGQEIVIHGYFHQRAQKDAESPLVKFMTRLYTANEGEFFDIGQAEAHALVSRAREEFASIGLTPSGFIAPAWLLSKAGEKALIELGLLYTTRLGGVVNLATGKTHNSQSMVYSVRSGWRRQVSLQWNASLYRRLTPNPLLRIGIHPVDFQHPAVWGQIRERISLALAQRQAMTYEGFLRAI
jgi:predicted deacetylase